MSWPLNRRTTAVVVGALVALPLIVAIIALRWKPWYPVLDMAMTEFRVRDVGTRRTPLIGLPGRIGNFPDQGSHPGPASFWMLAPFYRIGGSTAWAMQLGTVLINALAVIGIVVVWGRRAGWRGLAVGALIAAMIVRGYGMTVLTHPWNPYFPLIIWMLVLVCAWSVTCGDQLLAPVVVIGGSIAAQTHVPYLILAIAVVSYTLGWLIISAVRHPADRPRTITAIAISIGAGVAIWSPAFIDQWRRRPGNIRMLIDHFATPGDDPIGIGRGIEVFLRHLDAPGALGLLAFRSERFIQLSGLPYGDGLDLSVVGGAIMLAAFIASVVYAARLRLGNLLRLQALVSVTLVVGLFSMTRIFGKIWYYLALWAWSSMILLGVCIGWAVWHRWLRGRLDDRRLTAAAFGVAGIVTVISIGAGVAVRVPEPMLSAGLGAAIEPTLEAIDPEASYVVFWQDSVFIGAQGYGLVNELERRGVDVGVHPTWRVPVTPYRVMYPGDNDAEIHFVSGMFIDEWRAKPDHVEIVEIDPRTTAQRDRFDVLHDRVVAGLTEIGRTDLIDEVSFNLFGASLDPDLPETIRRDLSEMLLIGEPVAVFLAPAGSTR